VITILLDHHLEGQARRLWSALSADGWIELGVIRFVTLTEAGLSTNSSDRVIWRFAQEQGMLLLTDNRNMKGDDSLEQTLREENTPAAFPVITIGNSGRLDEQEYRGRCATRLVEIVLDLRKYLGVGRLFIP
jgi:hypothetical protein